MSRMVIDFDGVCDQLKNNISFTLSRFGDGEWSAILGRDGENCDNHRYFPEMGRRLAAILRNEQRYYLANHLANPANRRVMEAEVNGWLIENAPHHEWSDSGLFHIAFKEGKITQLWESLAHRYVTVIGPHYMAHRANMLPFEVDLFLPVANVNCWRDHERIDNVLQLAPAFDVVLFCASMPACIWADIGFERSPLTTWIDLGSVLDPWVGNMNRSFTRAHYEQYGLKIDDIQRKDQSGGTD